MSYAIELKNISKHFGKLKANDNISIKITKGSVHAICGENGAGKSTLMNIIYGLHLPTSGEIIVNGENVHFKTAKDAIEKKVGMVHQHFMLVNNMTVAENIVLGKEPGSKLFYNRKKIEQDVLELSKKYNLEIDPRAKVEDITIGMQQRVEILKTLYRGVDILILDEPTAVLAPTEIEELFQNIRYLISQGKTIIIITHKLNEVLEISDEITVLRLGKKIGTVKTSEVDETKLTQMMVQRDVTLGGEKINVDNNGELILDIKNLSFYKKGAHSIKDISINVKKGEIVGIAGVDGNGQSELIKIIGGLYKHYQGSVKVNNIDISHLNVRKIKELGVGIIPEDRHKEGLILDYTIQKNLIFGKHYRKPYSKNKIIDKKVLLSNLKIQKEKFDIRFSHDNSLASELSGGNQQKIILAREITEDTKFILASQPTRGLDVGAIEFVHNNLTNARNNGQGILLVSFELDEILTLADRIYVFHDGKVAGEVTKDKFNLDVIGKLMLGLKVD